MESKEDLFNFINRKQGSVNKNISRKNKYKRSERNCCKSEKCFIAFIIILSIITSFLFYLCIGYRTELLSLKNNIKLSKEINNSLTYNNSLTNIGQESILDSFRYENYQREIFTSIKHVLTTNYYNGDSLMTEQDCYFLNGLIRYYKPKKLLEVGVNYGGSSALMLNAIQDINDSFLYSVEVKRRRVGRVVFKKFPQFLNKWKLFKGNIAAKFLPLIGVKFDFVLIDTLHVAPAELINLIEVLPFVKPGTIIVFHDIANHLYTYRKEKFAKYLGSGKYNEICLQLFSILQGPKKMTLYPYTNRSDETPGNIGGVMLGEDFKKYYINYFYLTLCQWNYIPETKQIEILNQFILKYYGNFYYKIWEIAVRENRNYINVLKNGGYKW